MKLIKILSTVLLVLILAIAAVLFVPKVSPKAVRWERNNSFDLTAVSVKGSNDKADGLNKEIKNYLSEYNKYYDQDILHFHNMRVIASTANISVVEIQTQLTRNATQETNGEYPFYGEKVVQLWVNTSSNEVKTHWVTVSDTIPKD